MTFWVKLPVLLVLGCCVACQRHARELPIPLQVSVTTEDLSAVSGATLSLDGKVLGNTDHSGELMLSLSKPEGTVVQLTLQCPKGFRNVDPSLKLALRRLQPLDPKPLANRRAAASLRTRFFCEPTERSTLLVVNTSGAPALGVWVDGVLRATTNDQGIAHVLLQAATGTSFQVLLETGSNSVLIPARPMRPVLVGEVDDIVVFDQDFKSAKSPSRQRQKAKIPYRID
ncbi:MAG TPA: hypothetical protein VL137_05495 [Polyangiaceae bacterium]|nr:hypothetical protein [Polyangiaceae bacterium]